jgi:hypothetical protein
MTPAFIFSTVVCVILFVGMVRSEYRMRRHHNEARDVNQDLDDLAVRVNRDVKNRTGRDDTGINATFPHLKDKA